MGPLTSRRKKNCIFSGIVGVVLAGAVLLSPTPGYATLLDFNADADHPVGVSISYPVLGGALLGVNIGIDSVLGVGTPANPGIKRDCVSCVLAFTTGNLTSTTATTWNFGGGPATSITITGGIDLNNDGDIIDLVDVPFGSKILSGKFGSATVTKFGSFFKIAGSVFGDQKVQLLKDFYGLGAIADWDGNFNLSFLAAGSPPATFTSTTVGSGDVFNQPVPEPTSLLLLGSGLVGLGFWGRRRFPDREGEAR